MATKKAPVKTVVVKAAPRPVGRQTIYTDAIADAICTQLSEGRSLNAICKQLGFPKESTVRLWAMDDVNGFAAKYARARELGYAMLAEELLEIADTPVIGVKTVNKATGIETTEGDMIERSRLRVDTRKWMLSKMLPKIYGDKIEVDQKTEIIGTLDMTLSPDEAYLRMLGK